ncbi:MAG: hypothetical protein Q8Q88_18360 [Phenylobacterium sp.]|uniref:hypothetical protein n=1 Tax=Phenylobacterium sp. TaxID=1871053 RepID=UPI00273430CD|nr:hypothetical protein [Phenylobacterium sp.]MDP3749007.1 hypothetical protein [Phenylobacterium sp.]
MRALLTSVASLAAFAAGPTLAQQDHAGHHPTTAGTAPAASTPAADAMHEKCKTVMASKMAAKQPHDHGRDKTGAPTWPQGKKLSPEEMEKLHKQCETMMSKDPAPAPK